MKKIFFLIPALSFSLPLISLAVTVPNTVTLVLPSSGESYILSADSDFDSLTVNNDNFVFALSGTQGFILTSADLRKLTNDQSISYTCSSSESRMAYQTSSVSISVTITPSGTCSTSGSGGGGGIISGSIGGSSGGGGGGGGSSTPAPAPTPTPVPTPSATPTPAPVPSSASISFTKDLAVGSTGNDVTQLQALLAADPAVYPEGQITGYYGSLTRAAVRRFQAKYGLPQVGRVGPMTREKLMSVFGSITPVPAPIPSSTPSSSALSRELEMGVSGDDVRALQEFLAKDSSVYPQGTITGYYGALTKAAVRKFKAKYGLAQVGRVGPLTLAKLQELMAQ